MESDYIHFSIQLTMEKYENNENCDSYCSIYMNNGFSSLLIMWKCGTEGSLYFVPVCKFFNLLCNLYNTNTLVWW